jgi:hypothetical protein
MLCNRVSIPSLHLSTYPSMYLSPSLPPYVHLCVSLSLSPTLSLSLSNSLCGTQLLSLVQRNYRSLRLRSVPGIGETARPRELTMSSDPSWRALLTNCVQRARTGEAAIRESVHLSDADAVWASLVHSATGGGGARELSAVAPAESRGSSFAYLFACGRGE